MEAGTVYPIFGVKAFHGHFTQSIACENEGTTALHHRDIVAVIIIISSDVVAGVTTANYHCLLSLAFPSRRGELR